MRSTERSLFNLEGTRDEVSVCAKIVWGYSSAGRAPALQAGGQRFDPANLHHILKRLTEVPLKEETSLSLLEIQLCTLKTEHCYYDAIMRRQQ